MFLQKYVDKFYYDLIVDNYDERYLMQLDEKHFLNIYNIFKEYGFYYLDDIVLKYLEIFQLDEFEVLSKINDLNIRLGKNYIDIIGKDLRYLNDILLD